jgi:hypothetical protein
MLTGQYYCLWYEEQQNCDNCQSEIPETVLL